MHVSRLMRRGIVAAAVALTSAPLLAGAASAAGSPPNQPTALALVSGNRTLAASWAESSTGTITYIATAKAAGHPTRSCRSKAKRCTVVSLVNGVEYSVSVVAKNANGKSTASDAVLGTPGTPLAPNSVHATASTGGKANVRWAPPLASGVSAVTGYTASTTSTTDATVHTCTTTGARSCSLTGLVKGAVYKVSVTATNKWGTGPSSKAFTFTGK